MSIVFPDFSRANVLVVGDCMLDRYIHGQVSRVSPEAPVPVVQVKRRSSNPGGAANVALNIASLGGKVELVGFTGVDEDGAELTRQLTEANIRFHPVSTVRPTISKLRVVGDRQQIVRLDTEDTSPVPAAESIALLESVRNLLRPGIVVVLSDYGKGALSAEDCRHIIEMAHLLGISVLVDPKTQDWTRYHGATLVTPNFKEFREALAFLHPGNLDAGSLANADAAVEAGCLALLQQSGLPAMLVTRSERGMTLAQTGSNFLHLPAQAREVFDVSGAGDTVIATIATALAAGSTLAEAAAIANQAAGIVVGKAGTRPITREELLQVADRPRGAAKVLAEEELLTVLGRDRTQGRRIVFTNGCFDILHRGHLELLREARLLGDRLVVGLNSDASIRRLKGAERPVVGESDRAALLAALESVDYVCLFREDTPERLLARIRPDVLVKGGDYKPETVLGREYAGEVRILPFVDGKSTSSLIQKIRTTP